MLLYGHNVNQFAIMTPQQVIKYYHGEALAAEALKCTRQAINYWKRTGSIPLRMQAVIHLKTNGALRASMNKGRRDPK